MHRLPYVHIVIFPVTGVARTIIMSYYRYYLGTMLLYGYGDCSSDNCNLLRVALIRKNSISARKCHHVNSINIVVLLHVIYYNLLSSAVDTIYRSSKSETIH